MLWTSVLCDALFSYFVDELIYSLFFNNDLFVSFLY